MANKPKLKKWEVCYGGGKYIVREVKGVEVAVCHDGEDARHIRDIHNTLIPKPVPKAPPKPPFKYKFKEADDHEQE